MNKLGLIIGFVGTFLLTADIFGEKRILRLEKKLSLAIPKLTNPKKFIMSIYDEEERIIGLYWIIIPFAVLWWIYPILFYDIIRTFKPTAFILELHHNNWGLNYGLYIGLSTLGLIIFIVLYKLSHQYKKIKDIYVWVSFILSFVFLLPSLPYAICDILLWILFLIIILIIFWIVLFPFKIGFYLQRKFNFKEGFKISGFILILISFILALLH